MPHISEDMSAFGLIITEDVTRDWWPRWGEAQNKRNVGGLSTMPLGFNYFLSQGFVLVW